MRRIALIALLLVLAVPSGALALASENGTLEIANGRGSLQIRAKGGTIGTLGFGKIWVEDVIEGDGNIVVYGAEGVRLLTDSVTVYSGSDIRFRTSGLVRIRVSGSLFNVSVSGRGSALLDGAGGDDGTYSLDGSTPRSLPDAPTRFSLGTPLLGGQP